MTIEIEDVWGNVNKHVEGTAFDCAQDGRCLYFCISVKRRHFTYAISPEDAIIIADEIATMARSIIDMRNQEEEEEK